MRYLKEVLDAEGGPPMHLHEEARELGWDDEQLIEAIAFASLEVFTAMVEAPEPPLAGTKAIASPESGVADVSLTARPILFMASRYGASGNGSHKTSRMPAWSRLISRS